MLDRTEGDIVMEGHQAHPLFFQNESEALASASINARGH
jgi:hypothetical protein